MLISLSPSLPENRYHVRSISLPTKSHPLTLRAEEEINKLRSWETTSTSTPTKERICIGLVGLGNLHDCVDDLLQLPLTQQAIAHHQHEKWVQEVLDGSVRLLDVCGATRDILMSMKDHVQVLQLSLRRRGGLMSSIDSYIRFRKKVKKDMAKLLGELKRMDNKCAISPLLDQDPHLSMVVRVLRELRAITISVLQAVFFSFLSLSKPKTSKWSLVSRLMHKGLVACEGEAKQMNEVENVAVALSALCQDMLEKEIERVKTAQKRLKALEIGIEDVEGGLECLFKRLIQTRVSLLNILSH